MSTTSQEIPLRQAGSFQGVELNTNNPSSSTFTGSSVSFAHLSYTIKTKTGEKKLINDVSVTVKAGELLGEFTERRFRKDRQPRLISSLFPLRLTAIMGPSGAGECSVQP